MLTTRSGASAVKLLVKGCSNSQLEEASQLVDIRQSVKDPNFRVNGGVDVKDYYL